MSISQEETANSIFTKIILFDTKKTNLELFFIKKLFKFMA